MFDGSSNLWSDSLSGHLPVKTSPLASTRGVVGASSICTWVSVGGTTDGTSNGGVGVGTGGGTGAGGGVTTHLSSDCSIWGLVGQGGGLTHFLSVMVRDTS